MCLLKLGKEINVDLPSLVDTRMLICANSGGGKSYLVRKLLEEVYGQVMVIVLDIEGEYRTLREKYDYLLIGKDADIPISMKATSLLPKKLMYLNMSTIIDISELKSKERMMYVKKFLTNLVELPQKYWKPCLVVVEEAHKFCGQQGKHDSGPAIIDLMTRGRKRGLAGVLVTQRIAKLHKDAAAEANNVFVGRMWLDNDQKRAADLLGFSSKDMTRGLRDLDPGMFYMFGPAIKSDVNRGMIGKVKTNHPKIGMQVDTVLTPNIKISKIISELMSLTQEAEDKKKKVLDYEKRIKELEREVIRENHTKWDS